MFYILKISLQVGVIAILTSCMVVPDFPHEDQLKGLQFQNGIRVVPPEGYCLDNRLIEEGPEAGFAVILPCSDVIGTLKPGLFTLTVVPSKTNLFNLTDIASESDAAAYHADAGIKHQFRKSY